MFERATREWRMSPQIATVRPSMRPRLRRMVSASSSAWVGCSCAPSPALTTEQSTLRARKCTAPAWWCLTTRMSGRMALSVMAVSISVSPFLTLDAATAMFITSAPRRLPASSNDDWVRVDASKNRLIWVRPRKVARFFSTCREIVTASSARSSNATISSRDRCSMPRRWRWEKTGGDGAIIVEARFRAPMSEPKREALQLGGVPLSRQARAIASAWTSRQTAK